MTTLMGGLTISVMFADGHQEEIQVRQIPIGEYEQGFRLRADEIALVGFLCGKDKAWATSLHPIAYEEVLKTGQEVNAQSFFPWLKRRAEQELERQAEMLSAMATLPPETAKLAMQMGAASISPTPSQPSRTTHKLI